MKHVTAIVVARAGSQRVPGKALRPFGDSTLIGHKIDQLKQCKFVHEVVVGSDDDAILREAQSHGASIRKRDDYHCDEAVCSANEMIRNMAAQVEADIVLWAHPTNPLCTPKIYDQAIRSYRANEGLYDSLCSVTRIQRHAWQREKNTLRPTNFDPWGSRHPLASSLGPCFYQDGAIFIQPHEQMLDNSYFYGDNPRLFEVQVPYGFDIDTERDLSVARAIHTGMKREAIL